MGDITYFYRLEHVESCGRLFFIPDFADAQYYCVKREINKESERESRCSAEVSIV